LEERVEAYEDRYPDAVFDVDIEDGLAIQANDLARSVVDSIVDNAVVHNDSHRSHVEIWTVQAADRIQVHVADDGPGITDEMKSIVFQQAVTTDQTASGFGLHFVSVLMNLYAGNLRFEDNDPHGTVAVLEFKGASERPAGGATGEAPSAGRTDSDGSFGPSEVPGVRDGEGIEPENDDRDAREQGPPPDTDSDETDGPPEA
jgi:K+-sensing histidine kinase KdpD